MKLLSIPARHASHAAARHGVIHPIPAAVGLLNIRRQFLRSGGRFAVSALALHLFLGVAAAAPVRVDFEYQDGTSERVSLVGSFNQWNAQANLLVREDGDRWKCSVMLEPYSE